MTVIGAYLDAHRGAIRTEAYVERAETLVFEFLTKIGQTAAPVAFWTPSRCLEFARHLTEAHRHKASTVERIFNVLSAAFKDAALVKMRIDPFGNSIEGSLMSHTPKVGLKKAAISKDLRLPNERPKVFVPTMEEMARFIDALNYEHLRRWALLALATWARPEAVTDFDPAKQWDRRTNALDLNVEGRPETNKRRAVILAPQALRDAIPAWQQLDMEQRAKDGESLSRPWFPLMRGDRKIGSVKRGVKLTAALPHVGLKGITAKTPRTFMATHVIRFCPGLPREMRSRWMGHTIDQGSSTTSAYEKLNAGDLADAALATDFVLQQLQRLCRTRLLAVELRLNHEDLRRLGAQIALD